MRPPVLAFFTAASFAVVSSQSTQNVEETTATTALPTTTAFDSVALAESLAQLVIPMDDLDAVRSVGEWAMGSGNWSDEARITLWLKYPKLVLLQPLAYFQKDLDSSSSFIATLLTSKRVKQFDADVWSGVPLTYTKLWYATLGKNPFAALINAPYLAPLMSAAPDADVIDWQKDWTEKKHDLAIGALSSGSLVTGHSQVQLLAAPLTSAGKAKPGPRVIPVLKANVQKLDVSQLRGLFWEDASPSVPFSNLIAIAKQSSFDEKVINEKTDASSLGLYSALKIREAVDQAKISVTKDVLKKAMKLRLTRGQAMVLADGYVGGQKDKLLSLPSEYLFAMSRHIAGLEEGKGLKNTLKRIIEDSYGKLLPSQRLAVFWRYFNLLQKDEVLQRGFVQLMDEAYGRGPAGIFAGNPSSNTFLNFASPRVFQQTSNEGQNLVNVCSLKGNLEVRGSYFPSVPFSFRRCIVNGSQAVERVPFPLLMALQAVNISANGSATVLGAPSNLSTFQDLATLGSSAFGRSDLGNLTGSSLKLFVSALTDLEKCVCLGGAVRKAWQGALLKAYGEPEDWSMSDFLELGGLLHVFDNKTLSKVGGDAFRRAAPVLVQNGCLGKLFSFFPGFTEDVSFEDACKTQLPKGDADSFSEAASLFRTSLYESSLWSVRIALSLRPDPEVKVSTAKPTTQARKPLDPEVRQSFVFSALSLAADLYNSSDRLTEEQRSQYKVVVRAQSGLYREAISETLKVPLQDLPNGTNEIGEFIRSKEDDLTLLEFQVLTDRLNNIALTYAKNLTNIMGFTNTDLSMSREDFCALVSCEVAPVSSYDGDFSISKWLERSLPATSEGGECLAARASGFAVESLTVESLESWSDDDLLNCLEVLGSARLPESAKSSIWQHLMSKVGDRLLSQDGQLRGGAMLLAGNFLPTIARENQTLLRVTGTIEPLSLLGTADLDHETASAIATRYAIENKLKEDKDSDPVKLASLGNLFCGLPLGIAKAGINFESARLLGATLTKCGNPVILKSLSDALRKQKPAGEWTATDVSAFGIIIAGLPLLPLSKIPVSSFRTLSPEALSHFKPGHIAALDTARLSAIPEESMSVLRADQLSTDAPYRLTRRQVSAIGTKHGWAVEKVLSDYVKAAKLSINRVDKAAESDPEDGENSSGTLRPSLLSLLIIVLLRALMS